MSVKLLSDLDKLCHTYLFTLDQETKLKKRREDARDQIKQALMEGETDEAGNYTLEFEKPVSVDGEVFIRGLQAQRRVSEYLDDETAMHIIESHNLRERCVKEEVREYIDYDEIFAANQEGLISDREIDDILQYDVSYSLVKLK